MLRAILTITLLFPSATDAFFFFFDRCPGYERCGIFGFSVTMHSGNPGGSDCLEYCYIFVDPALECGGCGIGTEELPTSAPAFSSPTAVTPTAPVPRPSAVTPTAPEPAPIPSTQVSEYDISIQLVGIPLNDQTAFNNAVARWEQVVVGDLVDVSKSSIGSLDSDCTVPSVIDDLHICAKYIAIDGEYGVLGSAGPYYSRSSNGLPIAGVMEFDSADIEFLKSDGAFVSVILHEMGHILGIGTRWYRNGVTGSDLQNCPYRGTRANAEYAAISGCNVVPTELDGGSGTACGHWDEECMGSELMTGYLNSGPNPLSRITVATLADLGYTVDYSTADAFTSSDLDPSCICRRRRTLMNMIHGETLQLGLRVPGVQRRRLSDEAYNTAMAYGQEILASRKFGSLLGTGGISTSPDVTYVADKVVNVLVADNGGFFDVVVRADE